MRVNGPEVLLLDAHSRLALHRAAAMFGTTDPQEIRKKVFCALAADIVSTARPMIVRACVDWLKGALQKTKLPI